MNEIAGVRRREDDVFEARLPQEVLHLQGVRAHDGRLHRLRHP